MAVLKVGSKIYDESYKTFEKKAKDEGKELEDKGKSILEDERLKAIICVSKWQVEHINLKRAETLGYIPSNSNTYIQVISNAIDPNDWENINVPKVPNSFIYSSATDRGLEDLIKM